MEAMQHVQAYVAKIDEQIQKLKQNSIVETVDSMSDIQKAKLNVAFAYSVHGLHYVLLKSQGLSSKDARIENVKKELERVKQYVGKIAQAEKEPEKPGLKLDVRAANRFVKSALSSEQPTVEGLKKRKSNEIATGETPIKQKKQKKNKKTNKKKTKR